MRYLILLLVFFTTPLFFGCSDENSQALFEAHVAAWYADHPGNVVYSTASFIDECGICHGLDLMGSGGAPSCYSATFDGNGCHAGTIPHPIGQAWLLPSGHVASAYAVDANCFDCHTSTGVGLDPPACQECHIKGDPLVLLNCTSCHSVPPGTVSTLIGDRPDREGAHTVHESFTILDFDCDTCHQGGGTGELTHYDLASPADVAFVASFNSNSGPAAYETVGGTCSMVSCHGGQATPDWLTGSLVVESQCTICHQDVVIVNEPNSYYSGEHDRHVNGEFIFCTECHNTINLAASHFNNLANPDQWLISAGATIGGGSTSIGTYVDATNECSNTCHGDARTW